MSESFQDYSWIQDFEADFQQKSYSRRVVVSYKRKYVHKLLVNRLLKPAQEKVWLSELTVPQWP